MLDAEKMTVARLVMAIDAHEAATSRPVRGRLDAIERLAEAKDRDCQRARADLDAAMIAARGLVQ